MEEPAEFRDMPELDDFFVLSSPHREPSHRERELEAERLRARERAEQYRAQRDLGIEAARRARRRRRRRLRTAGTGNGAPTRRRQAVGLVIAAAVIAAAFYLDRHPNRAIAGPVAIVPAGPCPASIYPLGAAYRFEKCSGAAPVGWGACRTLTVSVDRAGAPPTWSADVDSSLGQLTAATGLRIRRVAGLADITIGWVPDLGPAPLPHADKAGVTDVEFVSAPGGARLVAARIRIATAHGVGQEVNGEVPVILHELAHAVGLGHFVGAEVMNPVDRGYLRYQPGDLAGLDALYHPAHCR